jgi:hypothetical protein
LEEEMDSMKAVEEAQKLLKEAKDDFFQKGFSLKWDIKITLVKELPPHLQAIVDRRNHDCPAMKSSKADA